MSYTPGSWVIDHEGHTGHIKSTIAGTPTVARYDIFSSVSKNKEKYAEREMANARLIAAAPEMLDHLYELLPVIEDMESDPTYKKGYIKSLIKTTRKLIEKAEGRPL